MIGLRSHCIRPRESGKSDCAYDLQRKAPENLLPGFEGTLSLVPFECETCRIAAISGDSCSNPAGFLRCSDCVAEGEEFEPAVRF
jgi:hypothetical protein